MPQLGANGLSTPQRDNGILKIHQVIGIWEERLVELAVYCSAMMTAGLAAGRCLPRIRAGIGLSLRCRTSVTCIGYMFEYVCDNWDRNMMTVTIIVDGYNVEFGDLSLFVFPSLLFISCFCSSVCLLRLA